jgi:hypothetical protein
MKYQNFFSFKIHSEDLKEYELYHNFYQSRSCGILDIKAKKQKKYKRGLRR